MVGYHRFQGHDLSPREREVIDLMAKGLTNREIAERLDVSFATAKNHVSAVIGKLGVETRDEAVLQWRREQRVGARFSRAMRGMVVGVGLGKVAAGIGGIGVVATVGIATAIAVASTDPGVSEERGARPPILEPAVSAQTDEFEVMSIESGGREIVISVQPLGDEMRLYVFDRADPTNGIESFAPSESEQWLSKLAVEQFGILYGWFSSSVAADRSAKIVFPGMDPVPVDVAPAPFASGLDLRFWIFPTGSLPPPEEVLILDGTNQTVWSNVPDSKWQRPEDLFPGKPTPTPAR